MAGSIRGITVEIGGDTTKLGKALEDVNKRSRELSSELGQVNKLLKMDPGNTDLLSQKQKVLADAVSNTKEKLDTLKNAEKQVQEQFKKGEVSEEQVRALQREIIATTKKLETYERASKETGDELKKLNKESSLLHKVFKKTKDETDKASDALDDMADSADDAGDSADGLGSKLSGVVSGGITALAGAVTGITTALVGSAEATREYRTNMGKLETAFTSADHDAETATKTYQALQGVLGESDQAVEASAHLAKLCQNEEDLANWTTIATGVYAEFGASLPIENLAEASNETAKTGQLTGGLADALNWAGVNEEKFQESLDACSNEQERQALITETLNGLYSESAEKYRETNAEVIRANEANEKLNESMAEVGSSVEPMITDVKLLGASFLQDLLPNITAVTDAFRGILNGDEGATSALGSAISGLITDLLNKITELGPTIAQVGISLITELVTTIIASLPQLIATGVDMLMAIVDGLVTAIPEIIKAIVDMIPQLVTTLTDAIPQIIQGAVDLFMAIVEAVPQIIPPLIDAIPQIITTTIDSLIDAIPQLLDGSFEFLMAIVDAIPLIVEEIVPQIPTIVTAIVRALVKHIPQLLEGAVELLMAIVQAIPQIVQELGKAMPQILTAVLNGIIDLPEKIGPILSDTVDRFIEFGGDVIDGIIEGIGGAVSGLYGSIKDALGGLVQKAKDALDINSPSRVFEKQVGEQIANGLVKGINNKKAYVKKSAEELAEIYVTEGKAKVEQMKLANELTASDEVAFWESIVKSCKAGTEAYDDATTQLLKSKATLNSSMASLDATYAKDVQSVKDKLIADIQAVSTTYDNEITARQNQITSSLKLFEAFKANDGVSKKDLQANIVSQVAGLAEWNMLLDNIENREGMDAGLMEELQNMGVESLATIREIAFMTDEELASYVALYRERERLALERSEAEHEALKTESEQRVAELVAEANTQLSELEKTYVEQLKALGVTTTDQSKQIGKDIVAGLKDGITAKNAEFSAFLTSYFQSIVSTAKNALQIKSPSRIFADVIGKQIPAGVAMGISDNADSATDAVKTMADAMIDQANALNGATINRKLSSTFSGSASPAVDGSAVLSALNGIYERLNRMQIVLDTGTLVGETIDKIDAGLAGRQLLSARGV